MTIRLLTFTVIENCTEKTAYNQQFIHSLIPPIHSLYSSGMITSVTNFASSVSRNMDRLSLDSAHEERQEQNRRVRPNGMSDGLIQGLTGFGLSLLGQAVCYSVCLCICLFLFLSRLDQAVSVSFFSPFFLIFLALSSLSVFLYLSDSFFGRLLKHHEHGITRKNALYNFPLYFYSFFFFF